MHQQQPQVVVSPPISVTPGVAVVAPGAAAPVRSSYASRVPASVLRGHVIMGAIQIAVGCLVILLCIIGLATGSGHDLQLIGSGIWSGPFFIIAGVCGVVAGKGVKGCTLGCVITCLVFCIIASILGFTALILESVVTSGNRMRFENPDYGYGYMYSRLSIGEGAFRAVYATGIICILLFALEFVLAIVHAAYACRASCCCVTKAAPSRYQQQQQPHQQQVYMGQQLFYNGQPFAHPGQVVAAFPGQQVSYVGQQVSYVGQQVSNVGQQAVSFSGPQQAGYPGQPAPGYSGYQQAPGYSVGQPDPGYPGQQAPGHPDSQQAPGYSGGQQAPGYSGAQQAPGHSASQQPPPYEAAGQQAKF